MAKNSYINWMTALRGVGSLEDAYGKYSSAQQSAGIDELNAGLADQQAIDSLDLGAQAAVRRRAATEQAIGTQRTAIAKNNLAASGTALDLLSDTARFGAMDETTLRNNAARQAWGYRAQAATDRYSAQVRRRQGTLAALGSLATGLSDTAGYYEKLKQG